MIVDHIYEYLSSTRGEPNGSQSWTAYQFVIDETIGKLHQVLTRQLLWDKETKPRRLYVTRFSHPCARKGAYAYHGFEAEEIQPRAKINFLIGDVVELAVYTTARLAGCGVALSQARIVLDVDGHQASGYIDGIIEDHILEIKSMNSYGFRRFQRNGLDDTWGYLSQVNAYMKGMNVDQALLVALNKETGALHERVVPFDEAVWLGAWHRAKEIVESTPEELPNRTIMTVKAKEGREKLGLQCSYCNYRHLCWPEARMELARGKPVWYVEKEGE